MKYLYKCSVLCGRTKSIIVRKGTNQSEPPACIGECDCGKGLMVRIG